MKFCDDLIWKMRLLHASFSFSRRDSWVVNKRQLPKITRSELKQIKRTWPSLKVRQRDMAYIRLFKQENGFSPYYLNDYQMFSLLHVYNNAGTTNSLANKALYDVYLQDIPFPKSILKCINGTLYDRYMNVVYKASSIISKDKYNKVIIKPSINSASGQGVALINLKEIQDVDKFFYSKIKEYTGNFIVQEVLTQHNVLQTLNESSINSCRITSCYINGSYFSFGVQKIGKSGAFIDNWNKSYYVGVHENGSLFEYGYDNQFNRVYQSDSGTIFKNIIIPNYPAIIAQIKKYHLKYFPQIGFVGWDVVVNENGELIVIEANLGFPGIRGEQLCCGPIFKNIHQAINKQTVLSCR